MLSSTNMRKFDIKWSVLETQPVVPETIADIIAEYTNESEEQDSEDIYNIFNNFENRVYFYPACYADEYDKVKWKRFKRQCYNVIKIWNDREYTKLRNKLDLHLYKNEETKQFLYYLQGTRQTLEWMYEEIAWFNGVTIIEDIKINMPELI